MLVSHRLTYKLHVFRWNNLLAEIISVRMKFNIARKILSAWGKVCINYYSRSMPAIVKLTLFLHNRRCVDIWVLLISKASSWYSRGPVRHLNEKNVNLYWSLRLCNISAMLLLSAQKSLAYVQKSCFVENQTVY